MSNKSSGRLSTILNTTTVMFRFLTFLLVLHYTFNASNGQLNLIRQDFEFPPEQEPPRQRPMRQQQRPTSSTAPPPVPGVVFQLPNCSCLSTFEYNPVCGSNGVTYANMQKLRCAQECNENVRFVKIGGCTTRG